MQAEETPKRLLRFRFRQEKCFQRERSQKARSLLGFSTSAFGYLVFQEKSCTSAKQLSPRQTNMGL